MADRTLAPDTRHRGFPGGNGDAIRKCAPVRALCRPMGLSGKRASRSTARSSRRSTTAIRTSRRQDALPHGRDQRGVARYLQARHCRPGRAAEVARPRRAAQKRLAQLKAGDEPSCKGSKQLRAHTRSARYTLTDPDSRSMRTREAPGSSATTSRSRSRPSIISGPHD